jgi:E3 ubiquitin-protein ligase DOA10
MRSGAMWFVKDPQDQNAHPIRDILDRPTFTQLRKICVSGIMYSIVVACVVGSVAGLLLLGSKSIMPFRWKNRSMALTHILWSVTDVKLTESHSQMYQSTFCSCILCCRIQCIISDRKRP